MKRLLLLFLLAVSGSLEAQLLSWTPHFPKEDDATQELRIVMDANKGNAGLLNYTPVTDVYVHIGVITNLSADSTDWKYSKFTWATTPVAANAPSTGPNQWTYTIQGSLRTYFGITNPAETIKKIAILFRSGNGSKAQRNSDQSDMYVPVYDNGLHIRIDSPFRQPKYRPVAEPMNLAPGSTVRIISRSSQLSTITHFNSTSAPQTSGPLVDSFSSSFVIPDYGSYFIIARADNGSEIRYDTLSFFVGPTSSPTAALPGGLQDGINYEPGDTSVTLVLRAPGKNVVLVLGDFNNWTPQVPYVMNRTPDGKFFWLRLTGLTAGTEYAYQYLVDNSIRIADPYTEKVLDKNNDPFIPATTYPNLKPYPAGQTGIVSVLQTAAPEYTWSNASYTRPDKRGLVIYELLVRDFLAAHDWQTLRDTLNYLKKLGVNAIEIMPFNEFENNNSWGYNTYQYFAPDKYYGTAHALKEFIDTCHNNGIAVIMDIVLNHTYGPSPLAQLYWDAINNRPAQENPWYNPVQPHAFGFGEDFNHESPDTKYFFNRVLRHWVAEYRLDGYRFDFSKGLTQRPSVDDAGFSAYDASRIGHIMGYTNAIREVDPNSIVILEHFTQIQEERQLADSGLLIWGNQNFTYSGATRASSGNWDFSGGIASVKGLNQNHLVTYMESHDEERLMRVALTQGAQSGGYNIRDTTTALKRMELNAAFFLTLPGPKMIWQFGELGYDYSINHCPDGTINNNCRVDPKPIRWDYLNDARRKSVYTTYSRLNALRFHPWYRAAFQTGTVQHNFSSAFKWLRVNSGDSSRLVVVGNFGTVPVTGSVTFPSAGTWFNYFSNTTFSATGSPQNISLEPGEYRVYVNRNVNNVQVTPVSAVTVPESFSASIYPNPSQGDFNLDLDLVQSGRVTVELYTAMGQHASTLYQGFLVSGKHRLPMQYRQGSAGSYYLKIISKNGSRTLAITLQ